MTTHKIDLIISEITGKVLPYSYCLNAMHEAWCSLTKDQHKAFRRHLAEIVLRDGHVCGPCRSLSNATAAQRAEAILRTLNLWEETA